MLGRGAARCDGHLNASRWSGTEFGLQDRRFAPQRTSAGERRHGDGHDHMVTHLPIRGHQKFHHVACDQQDQFQLLHRGCDG